MTVSRFATGGVGGSSDAALFTATRGETNAHLRVDGATEGAVVGPLMEDGAAETGVRMRGATDGADAGVLT